MSFATGFIGLGAMGVGMARNLHRHQLLNCVWNRTPDRAAALAGELQLDVVATVEELAARCDYVVICISADADVLAVTAQIAPHLKAGAVVIDCSTVSADTARTVANSLA